MSAIEYLFDGPRPPLPNPHKSESDKINRLQSFVPSIISVSVEFLH